MNQAIAANSPERVARRMRTEIPTPDHVAYALMLGHHRCVDQLMEHPWLSRNTPCDFVFERSDETVSGEICITRVYTNVLGDCLDLFEN